MLVFKIQVTVKSTQKYFITVTWINVISYFSNTLVQVLVTFFKQSELNIKCINDLF